MIHRSDRPSYRILVFVVFLVTMVIDQGSKFWASWQGFAVLNPGVSFGLFKGPLVTIALVIGFIALFEYSCPRWHRPYPVASGLLLGGAMGNIVDRLVVGGVRDWLPIPLVSLQNNIADYAIVVALMWIAWQELRAHV